MLKEKSEKPLCFIFTMKLGQSKPTQTQLFNINIFKPPLRSIRGLVLHILKFTGFHNHGDRVKKCGR